MSESHYADEWTLAHIAQLEAPVVQQQQEPLMWSFTGSTRLMDEHEARLEAKRCGGTTKAFPLYRAPVVQPGMVMVPREPTEAMLASCWRDYPEAARETWRAMIAAAEGKK